MGKTRAKARRNVANNKREFPVRDDESQMYAKVTKLVGSGRLMCICHDGVERMCRIRGTMIGRDWIHLGDVILISVRDFEPDKADVIFKYQMHEVEKLRKWNEPVTFKDEFADSNALDITHDVVFDDIDGI